MREIKFRAWDKDDKKMIYSSNELYIGLEGLLLGWLADKSDFELMQFTGLLDKNGKEIYEGDVITDIHGDKRVVEFHEGGFWCFYPDDSPYMPTEVVREVIGNIYESKHLLDNTDTKI